MKTLAIALVALTLQAEPPAQRSALDSTLDRYASGDFGAVDQWIPSPSITVGYVTARLEKWTPAQSGLSHDRQQLVKAAFALELAAIAVTSLNGRFPDGYDPTGHLDSPLTEWDTFPVRSWRAAFPLIAWGCSQLPSAGDVSNAERAWWRSSIAVLEDDLAWTALAGGRKQPGENKKFFAPAARELVDGHLAHARQRLGNDPHIDLATALARTQSRLLAGQHEDMWLQSEHLMRDEPARNPAAIGLAKKLLAPLENQPDVAAEASLHLGRIALREHHWEDAVALFERASSRTQDTFIQGAAAYLAGWANERRRRPADALASYRRASALLPRDRSVAMRLAAALYLDGQRDAGYKVMDEMVKKRQDVDVLSQLERGDARFTKIFLAEMRSALK